MEQKRKQRRNCLDGIESDVHRTLPFEKRLSFKGRHKLDAVACPEVCAHGLPAQRAYEQHGIGRVLQPCTEVQVEATKADRIKQSAQQPGDALGKTAHHHQSPEQAAGVCDSPGFAGLLLGLRADRRLPPLTRAKGLPHPPEQPLKP